MTGDVIGIGTSGVLHGKSLCGLVFWAVFEVALMECNICYITIKIILPTHLLLELCLPFELLPCEH